MDDSHRPWWLVVLLGICIVGLAVWQSTCFRPQVRVIAVLLALIYLGFLAFTIGGDPHGAVTWRSWAIQDYLFIGQAVLSVIAAVLLIGRPSVRGQAVWFGLLCVMNSLVCASEKSTGLASVLAILGSACFVYLIKEYWAGRSLRISELWPQQSAEHDDNAAGAIWLSGATGLVVSILLIGTIHFALQTELARATPTRRLSALPQPARIRGLLSIASPEKHSSLAMTKAFGARPDIVVLLAVLAFISFSAAIARHSTLDDEAPSEVIAEPIIRGGDSAAVEQPT